MTVASFLLLMSLPLFFGFTSATKFAYNGFQQSDGLIFRQSSSLEKGKLCLTRKGIRSDKGRVLFPAPLNFRDSGRASFSTTFIFSIEPGPEGLAQGMSFFIAPNTDPVANSGRGYLGLFNQSTNAHTFAIELDTYRNPEFKDMDDNHVGIDMDGIVSTMAVSPVFLTSPAFLNSNDGHIVNLKSGEANQIWIDYYFDRTELNMSVTDSPGNKPSFPFFSNSTLNLSAFLQDGMYIGFSASIADLTDIQFFVHAWSFSNEGPSAEITQMILKPSQNYKTITPLVAISVCISSVSIVCIIVGIVFGKQWKKKKKKKKDSIILNLPEEINCMSHNPQRFTYRELRRVTNGFSEKTLLGRGGFGTVHRGVLPNGTAIAVKLVSEESQQGVKEFVAEVSIIGRLRHRNLVPLLGWCSDKRGLALVYEQMPNGSLDTYLFNGKKKKTGPVLTWTMRAKILQGVAAGLVYLHEEWEEKIIHRDVKASNVLLDGEFNARLGDFGLARPYRHGVVTLDTTHVVGTYGYLAPEYMFTRKATEKVDVYSFGALVLEVITGKGIASDNFNIPLVDWLWQLHKSDRLLEAIDSSLVACIDCDHDAAIEALRLGLLCLHPDSVSRPYMRRVLQVLTRDAPLPSLPNSRPPLMDVFSNFPYSLSQTTAETSTSTSAPDDSDFQHVCRDSV